MGFMKFVQYEERFKDDVILLLSKGKSSDFVRDKIKIWNWQYSENPFLDNREHCIVAYKDDKVVGFQGLMPIKVQYMGFVVDGYWTCDAILSPEYRGKGYGKEMNNLVKDMRSVVMSFGLSDIQSYVRLKNGFTANEDIGEFFLHIKCNSHRDIIKFAIGSFMRFREKFLHPDITDSYSIRIIDASDPPEELDMLWDKIRSDYAKIAIRDHSYITWKYGKCPISQYKLITLRKDDELVAVGVYRISGHRSFLVDYVGPAKNQELKYLIVKSFTNQCSNLRLASCICSDEEFKKALLFFGFRRYRNKPRFYVCSNLNNDKKVEKNWFIMGGDSDGDFTEIDTLD
jgi:RimJ/RimL family protein N-acetyltransferase